MKEAPCVCRCPGTGWAALQTLPVPKVCWEGLRQSWGEGRTTHRDPKTTGSPHSPARHLLKEYGGTESQTAGGQASRHMANPGLIQAPHVILLNPAKSQP